jgi:hypothetical protein
MRHALSLTIALWVVMLVTTSATAHSRVFVGGRVGVPVHPSKLAPRAVVVSPGFVTVSPFHGIPQAAIVITPPRAIRPGTPLIVTRPSATFFPRTVFVSPPVRGAFPLRVTVPRMGVAPKVIMVETTRSTHQR